MKRKIFSIITIVLASFASLLLMFFDENYKCPGENTVCTYIILETLVLVLARFIIAGTISILALWVTELYPTTVRSVGYGLYMCM